MCQLCESRANSEGAENAFFMIAGTDITADIAKCPAVTQEDRDTAAGAYGKYALGIAVAPKGYYRSIAAQETDAA